MKNQLQITSSVDKPGLLVNMIEKLVLRREDIGYSHARVPQQWEAIDSSSTETSVSGTVTLNETWEDVQDRINMRFTTGFLFTCIKSGNGVYKIAWSSSLC